MMRQVREKYVIKYVDGYQNEDCFRVLFFSEHSFDHPKLVRKYIGQVSRKHYYRNGSKKWFYALLYWYELKIKKDHFVLDTKKSGSGYIYYSLKDNPGLVIINNTSGGTCDEGWFDYQGNSIHHCKKVGKRLFYALAAIAENNTEQLLTCTDGNCFFDGNYSEIMFISKYAPSNTNYNKSTYTYTSYRHTGNCLVDHLLCNGISLKNLGKFKEKYPNTFLRCDGPNIESDLNDWASVNILELKAIPVELKDALDKISNMNQRRRTKRGRNSMRCVS